MFLQYFYFFAILAIKVKVIQNADFQYFEKHLLPKDTIKVFHYNISIDLTKDFNNSSNFEGSTTISVQTLRETNEIKLHASYINFTKVEIRTFNDGVLVELETDKFLSNEETGILTLTTKQHLKSGTKYRLGFEYSGKLSTDNNGLYRSSYTDSQKNVKYLITTQFESTYARRAFPCFDEPEHKATFQIEIKHPSEYSAFSNNIGVSTMDPNGYNVTKFETTPVMSTYTVAFTVSDFTCSSGEMIDGSVLNLVCSTNETESFRKLALELAPKSVKVMEDFTKIQFSISKLKKLHQLAIPDFSAGAMENWGIHTFREQSMLYDSEGTSINSKRYMIQTIAHEISHFWFGNLVTIKWWSNLFLNEGFATYFSYFISHAIYPKAEFDKMFVVKPLHSALASDILSKSQPLSFEVYTTIEISYRFSSFLYDKGGSILRMVEKFMGLENFQLGLSRYLNQHKFNNTTPNDLWDNLQEFTKDLPKNLTFKNVIDNWVLKTGYPVLNVSTVGKNIKITQKRFVAKTQSSSDKWHIPISLTTSADANKFKNTKAEFWLSSKEIIVDRLKDESNWVILNNQQTGYYRVDYSQDLWNKISTALNAPNFDGIHELNRAQIIDDFYAFAKFGYRSFSELFDLYQFLKNDESYFSWYSATLAFTKIRAKISNRNLSNKLSNYISTLLQQVYKSVTIEEKDDHVNSLKKSLIIKLACKVHFQDCLDNALTSFAVFKTKKIKPDIDLRLTIYCSGLRYSKDSISDWNFLWQEFQNVKTPDEQLDILDALGCTNDRTLLQNYLEKSIDPKSGIRQQDATYVFQSVTLNSGATDIVLDFLTLNYQPILKYYSTVNTIPSIFSSLEKVLITAEYVDKFANFIENTELGEYESLARSTLETGRNNLKEVESLEKELNLYFGDGPSGSFIAQPQIKIVTIFLIVTLILA